MASSEKAEKRKLVGFENFVRNNPRTDKFLIERFSSIEFYCTDATTAYKRFAYSLGMDLVGKSDLSSGNETYASYVLKSNELTFIFTSPYNNLGLEAGASTGMPHPGFKADFANKFIETHGLAVRAITITTESATDAYNISVANGALGVLPPTTLTDKATGASCVISEITSVGDVVIRWIDSSYANLHMMLPNYIAVPLPADGSHSYGLVRADHVVSNVPSLFATVDYLCNALGLHEFSEFTAEDVGTVDSGLNSMVLANNNEYVLMPVNEPTFGTRRKSQIQNYLEHNNGAGVQHIALKTDDIFATMRQMRACGWAGLEFMPRPARSYYDSLPSRLAAGDTALSLTPAQLAELEELGLLADRDKEGILLQIFTKPIGDRPTIFFEVIQRIGCPIAEAANKAAKLAAESSAAEQTAAQRDQGQSAGCGGFGKGNFTELFKSIERFEETLEKK